MYIKYRALDGDNKILQDIQNFKTTEFHLCGLHSSCLSVNEIYLLNNCSLKIKSILYTLHFLVKD